MDKSVQAVLYIAFKALEAVNSGELPFRLGGITVDTCGNAAQAVAARNLSGLLATTEERVVGVVGPIGSVQTILSMATIRRHGLAQVCMSFYFTRDCLKKRCGYGELTSHKNK